MPDRLKACHALAPAIIALAAMAQPAAAEDFSFDLGGGVTVRPYGLYQLDVGSFSQSASEGQTAGFNPRRLRSGFRINIRDQVEAGVIWESGHTPGGQQRLFEAQATYIGFKPFAVSVGVFKPSFGLEEMQSPANILFLERAAISSITADIAAGIERQAIQIRAGGNRYHLAVALTAGTTGPGEDGDQRAVTARAVGLPIRSGDTLLSVGVSGEYVFRPQRNSGELPAFSLSSQPELSIDQAPSTISTGSIRTSDIAAVGPEIGLAVGRLWLQAEYYSILLNRRQDAGGGTLHFDGYYAQAAYTIVGKPRSWSSSSGAWGPPKPAAPFNLATGDVGAVEVGARFSTVNLKDDNISGGLQRVYAAVANWWPIDLLRFSLQYEHANITGGPRPRRLDAVAGRAQLSF